MPVSGYSTYAAYLSNVNGFQRLQTSLATLTQQLNSGKKSSDLTTYGVETQRLVDLRAEIARRQGYMEAIKSASTDVKAYDRVMTSIEDINATMLQAFTAPNTDPPTKQQHTITFSGDLGLVREARDETFLLRQLAVQPLDHHRRRDAAVRVVRARQVDVAHRAAAERFQENVRSEWSWLVRRHRAGECIRLSACMTSSRPDAAPMTIAVPVSTAKIPASTVSVVVITPSRSVTWRSLTWRASLNESPV